MQMWVSEVSEVMVLEDFFPFSSDVEAIIFLLLHSPRPVVSAVHSSTIGVHRVAEKGGRVGGENDAAREARCKFFRN